ncbi:Sm-like ribonucleoprotein, partial [Coprinopsis sp. MPI-PUGE-AT-0042]
HPGSAAGAQAQAPSHTGSPTDFLKGVIGKRVIVRLLSGVDYRGVRGFSVGDCQSDFCHFAWEHVNGKVVNRYGDAFIRGNNVLYISADEPL